jgi:hypothetical protein
MDFVILSDSRNENKYDDIKKLCKCPRDTKKKKHTHTHTNVYIVYKQVLAKYAMEPRNQLYRRL